MFGQSKEEIEATDIWHSFKEYILHTNRFVIQHPLMDFLKEYISTKELVIPTNSIFYRARIIDDAAISQYMMKILCDETGDYKKFFSKENRFRGLNKEGSFIPTDANKVRDGRANPKYIRYLYVAEDPVTAIFEVRPLITDSINVAEIQCNEELKIADMSSPLQSEEIHSKEQYLLRMIQSSFSFPTNNTDDYIPSQIIAEYIKSWGYEGIRYQSSLHRDGNNLTIFNYEKCEAISSRDMRMEDIKITVRSTMCSDIDYKMWAIKDNEFKEYDLMNTKNLIKRINESSKNHRL